MKLLFWYFVFTDVHVESKLQKMSVTESYTSNNYFGNPVFALIFNHGGFYCKERVVKWQEERCDEICAGAAQDLFDP